MEKLLNYAARFRSVDQGEGLHGAAEAATCARPPHRLLRKCRNHSSKGHLRSNRRGLRTGKGPVIMECWCVTADPTSAAPPPLALTHPGERMETPPDLIDFTAGRRPVRRSGRGLDPRIGVGEAQHGPGHPGPRLRRAHVHPAPEHGGQLRGAVHVPAVRQRPGRAHRYRRDRIRGLLPAAPRCRRPCGRPGLPPHPRDGYGLLVLHTHPHGDHVAGDAQFAGRPDTVVVDADRDSAWEFFGFSDASGDAGAGSDRRRRPFGPRRWTSADASWSAGPARGTTTRP